MEKLEQATRAGDILTVPGIREKTRENILKAIAIWKAAQVTIRFSVGAHRGGQLARFLLR